MNKEQTEEAIAVMQHWVDGGNVEVKARFYDTEWEPSSPCPCWDWENNRYRKEPPKPKKTWVAIIKEEKGPGFWVMSASSKAKLEGMLGIDEDPETVDLGLNVLKIVEVEEPVE